MGFCKDCAYFYETDNILLNKYACKHFNRYVKLNDSCPDFIPKPSGGSGCFLTSACVDYMGKADDCEELTALRNFRDKYMRSTESGKTLVDEYYAVAPAIVENINKSENKDIFYQYIYAVLIILGDFFYPQDNRTFFVTAVYSPRLRAYRRS